MQIIKIKGRDYNIHPTRDSFFRRATQYANTIIVELKKIGVEEHDIKIHEERVPIKRLPSSVTWWVGDHYCHFGFSKMPKFVDNLLVASKVIEYYVKALQDGKITKDEFLVEFKEEKGFDEERMEARKFFGLEDDHIDLGFVNKEYKKLAKSLHPDMPEGDIDKFKLLNKHHKVLKRELE